MITKANWHCDLCNGKSQLWKFSVAPSKYVLVCYPCIDKMVREKFGIEKNISHGSPSLLSIQPPNSSENWNCDGAGPHDSALKIVRVYPLGGNGNAILCRACWARENKYRYERGKETGNAKDWPQLNWNEAQICQE